MVATAPRLSDGSPFPTLYYLCHPAATAAVSTLEANQVMAEYSELVLDDAAVASAYARAHAAYLADRDRIEVVPEVAGISAGGLVGHALAAGPGVNPIGDLALERADWSPLVCECIDYTDKT